ncbi:hypothetical protein D8Y22_21850 [Salinadaptatus halalkaliphilus]|uniref:Uncharacterized protein n=2 Tax=Salinadaptatus halalkaliphilus TaxID=2419781 RepID=A0A4S3TG13_9EURY|nr:hypothetical protein [Salinadaptatus halalkaliphilus]THE62786.1 hypothetical protein D8Y22_21850 [Salinadaptatus halalkaliphilus]
MWQDLVFLAGSTLSIVFLAPTIRNATARVPLGSSVPSMTIGALYAFTYATMGMTFSAAGSVGVAVMWSLIACYRSPHAEPGVHNIVRFTRETLERGYRLAASLESRDTVEQHQSDHNQAAD